MNVGVLPLLHFHNETVLGEEELIVGFDNSISNSWTQRLLGPTPIIQIIFFLHGLMTMRVSVMSGSESPMLGF